MYLMLRITPQFRSTEDSTKSLTDLVLLACISVVTCLYQREVTTQSGYTDYKRSKLITVSFNDANIIVIKCLVHQGDLTSRVH